MAENIRRFECPVCLECYDSWVIPKLLPCIHTICQGCLADLLKRGKGKKMTCPVCRSDIKAPKGGVSGFKTNIYLVPDKDASIKKACNSSCSFCAQEDKTFQPMPCGDHRLCSSCVQYVQQRPNATRQCPICTDNAPVAQVSNLYPILPTGTIPSDWTPGQMSSSPVSTQRTCDIPLQFNHTSQPSIDALHRNTSPHQTGSRGSHVIQQQHMPILSPQCPPPKPQRVIQQPVPKTPIGDVQRRSNANTQSNQAKEFVKGPAHGRPIKPQAMTKIGQKMLPCPKDMTMGVPVCDAGTKHENRDPMMRPTVPKSPVTAGPADSPCVPTAPQEELLATEESPYEPLWNVDSNYETIFLVKDPLDDVGWYAGELSRQESERILMNLQMENGVFLVRKSVKAADNKHVYTIDVIYNNAVYHIKILRQLDGKYILGNTTFKPKEFNDVRSLIDFHQQTPFAMNQKETGQEIKVTLKCAPNQ